MHSDDLGVGVCDLDTLSGIWVEEERRRSSFG